MSPHSFEGKTRMNRSARWRVALLASAAWLLPATSSASGSNEAPLSQTTCSFSGMVDELRAALKTGSPAYRKYVKERLKMAARAMPADQLMAAVQQERDPDVLEALGAAVAGKASFSEDASLVQPLLARAASDADPALRAAAVRGLKGHGLGGRHGQERQRGDVRAAHPRQRARGAPGGGGATSSQENAKVYFGHDKTVSETAVATALASQGPGGGREAAARGLHGAGGLRDGGAG